MRHRWTMFKEGSNTNRSYRWTCPPCGATVVKRKPVPPSRRLLSEQKVLPDCDSHCVEEVRRIMES